MGNSNDSCPMRQPWRIPHPDLAWTQEFQKTLRNKIFTSAVESLKPCLMIVGPVSAGKSSLVNTFLSAGDNDIVQKADIGRSESSLTTKFTRYESVGILKSKYRVCDTMGILDDINRGIRPNDIIMALRGHVDQGYRFQEDRDISDEDPKYIKVPEDKYKSHCLVIVLDSSKVVELPKDYKQRVKVAISAARDEAIPYAIVLTKIDNLCRNVNLDRSKVFTCKHTKDVVAITSEYFGINESRIFPVINYSSQVSKVEAVAIDTIALLVLQKLLKLSYDYLEGPEFS